MRAYGAFEDPAPITLPAADGPGLCVIHGPNEAGKSTLLRAIRALIYGIPAQSPDRLDREYSAMRIAARLRFDDGGELAFTRRKRNKDPLYDHADGERIDAARLDRLVEAVPETLFDRLYGLDSEELRRGAAALLADDGEVGRAIYGASLGVANVRAVLDGLQSEAAALFAPRASKPRLNAAIAEWRETRKQLDELVLDPEAWTSQSERVDEGETRVAEIEAELREARARESHLGRIASALPLLAQRRAHRERLEAAGDVTPLPTGFAARVAEVRSAAEKASEKQRDARDRLRREEEERASLAPDPRIVEARDAIEALHAGLDRYRDTIDQLPRREAKRQELDQQIETLLGADPEVSPERMARLREAVAQAATMRARSDEGVTRLERARDAREQEAEADADLARARARAKEIQEADAADAIDFERLESALASARALGPVDERIAQADRELAERDAEIERDRLRLDLVSFDREAVEAVPFPELEWIESIANRVRDHDASREQQIAAEESLRGQQLRAAETIEKLRVAGEVPRPEQLAEDRAARDDAWGRVRRTALGEADRADDGDRHALVADFEGRSRRADQTADRLQVDARRVAERVTTEAEQARLEAERASLVVRREALEAAGAALDAEWRGAWVKSGREPESPEKMKTWRRDFDRHLIRLGERRGQARSRDQEAQARSEAIEGLVAATPPVAADDEDTVLLAPRLREAEEGLRRATSARTARERAAEGVAAASEAYERSKRRRVQAEKAVEEWRAEWRRSTDLLDLPAAASPAEVDARLDSVTQLLERLRERDQIDDRISKMRADLEGFEARSAALVEGCADDLRGRPASETVLALHRRLGEALEQQTLLRKSDRAIADARAERDEAVARLESSRSTLERLFVQAGVEDDASLDAAMQRWEEVSQDRDRLRDVEDALAALALGQSVEALAAEAAEIDADAIDAQRAELAERIERLTAAHREAVESLRSDRDRLEAMDGSAEAAELAAAREGQLAHIQRDAERYVEVRLAERILSDEIDRYRRENEGPVLASAGRFLAGLTRDRYPRVATDLDGAQDAVHLLAVESTAKGEREKAIGELSRGTRDQLFLALRLAALEQALDRRESMPFIADDLLVEFDDARTRAALEVLATLGERTQILLLSHHGRVAEMARELGDRAHVVGL